MFGLKEDWSLDLPTRYFTLDDYEGGVPLWCPGCGDGAVLASVQRLCRDKQLSPEKVVSVSGIGCSSRFPHYMATYGFHGLHGRAFPVACGVKSRRPDLTVFVATGDGDCCSIGAGHWVHAVRYNMDMTVMVFDNGVYGLTKNQTSPTSPVGLKTNTHPRGAWLPPVNPTQTTLGLSNVSFVAQTIDWNPVHLHATIKAAYEHPGLGFVHIMQRCPTYTPYIFDELTNDPMKIMALTHEKGIPVDPALKRVFPNQVAHDPSNIHAARELAERTDVLPIGLFFCDPSRPQYHHYTSAGIDATPEIKLRALAEELDRNAV